MNSIKLSSAKASASRKRTLQNQSARVWNLQVLHSAEELKHFESTWRKLTLSKAAPFLTYTWNLAWYEEFREEYDEMVVFVISLGRETRAILPCYRKGKEIRLAGDHLCDYQDIVARTESDASKGLEFVLRWLMRKQPGCSLFFEKASSEGWLQRLILSGRTRLDGLTVFSKCFAPCPMVEIGEGLQSYLRALPRKTRQDLNRSLARLQREYPEAKAKIRRSREIGAGTISDLAHFHDRNFRKDGVSPCRDLRWHRHFARVAKDPDVGLQVASLATPENTLAIDFGFARGGRYFGYLTSFDLAYRKWAPGKCLLLKRLDAWAMVDGVKVLDFLSGNEAYKKSFTQGKQYEVCSIHIMPDTFRNQVRKACLVAEQRGRSLARIVVRKLGLKK